MAKSTPTTLVRALAVALLLNLTACSTISSAYDSSVDTVSGWFKTDDKKK